MVQPGPKSIAISSIEVSSRPWTVSLPVVEMVAEIAEEDGLPHPVVVRARQAGNSYDLVAGAYMLGAAQMLGWKELSVGPHVLILGRGEFDPRILQEARRDMNALDLALFLAECRGFYEACANVFGKGGDRRSEQFARRRQAPRFSAIAAAATGYSDRTVRQLVRVAHRLDPEAVKALRGTSIENSHKDLVELCRMGVSGQLAAIAAIKLGAAASVGEAASIPLQ